MKKKLSILIESLIIKLLKYWPSIWLLQAFPKGKYHLLDIALHEKAIKNFIILDVGANVGQSVAAFNRWLKDPKVFSFEPVRSTYSELVKTSERFKSVSCFHFALGDEEKELDITLSHQNQNNSLRPEVFDKIIGQAKEKVVVKTLDGIYNELKVPRIDLLKIDTEGYEMEVLKGAKEILRKGLIKYIYCEVAFNDENNKVNFSIVNQYLKSMNYRLVGFYETNRTGPNFMFIHFSNALFMLKNENLTHY